MEKNHFFSSNSTFAVLLIGLLATASLQAQSFNDYGSVKKDSPSSFEAVVYPLSNQPRTIKVIFNNPTGGTVRVSIQNSVGKVFYNELEVMANYRRSFDLSSLPEGNYTVVLSKHNEQFAQTFAINSPVQPQSQIALLNPPYQQKQGKSAEKKLMVSQ